LAQIVLLAIRMGAKRVEDLIVWQLAQRLKVRIYELTETGPASRDWKFRDQLREAGGSTTRNISEGFGRFRHKEFAQFLRYSRGSLFEITDVLRDGITRKYWTDATVKDAVILSKRTTKAITRFIEYLGNNPDPYWTD
jgi:four helix bundle protein